MRTTRDLMYWIVLPLLIAVAGHARAQAIDDESVQQLKALNRAFTGIARRVTPSVVTIRTTTTVSPRRMREAHPFFDTPVPRDLERTGFGSGIIMSSDGYILTNHHVTSGADGISVTLSDNREFEASVAGADSLTDVAVIKIDARDLSVARMGNSDDLQIGEWVLAVGAPLQFRSTVTQGIVSALGRELHIISDASGYAIEDFIQTDAAINPGNSGGPLVNLDGHVVGVNTAIASVTGTFVGYGFAIPINLAKKVMDDIITHGSFRRGFLGIRLRPVDAGIADAMGLDRPKGVLIEEVLSDTPAEAAGLRAEDIIFSIDSQPVNRANQVQSIIARRSPDETVMMELQRGEKIVNLGVMLGERSSRPIVARAEAVQPGAAEHYGLQVANLTAELAAGMNVPEDTGGVVVTEVGRGPAREAGFAPDDIILRIRQRGLEQDIRNVEDFEMAISRLQTGRNASFVIARAGARRFLTMRIPEAGQ